MTEDTAAIEQPQEPDAPPQQSAEPESSSPDSREDSAPHPKEQPESRAEKRINQLVARMSNAEQRAARAEAELEALRKQSETPDPVPEPPARPKLSDFDGDTNAYAEALGDWTDKRIAFADEQREAAEARRRKAAEDRQQQESLSAKQQETLSWLQKGNDEIKDFVEIVTAAPICSQAMLDIAESMENGHRVLYELVQDPSEAARIAKLDGNRVAIEMTKRSQPKPGKEPSKAPDPPNPVKGGGDTPDRGDLRDDLPTEEWAKRFRSRRAKRRQAT